MVLTLARRCREAGGRAWVVGGAARDALLGLSAKDVDIEVHGLPAERVRELLSELGSAIEVGRSFGVFKLAVAGETLDVSLPRADSHAGAERAVVGEPDLGLDEAARRRDLTVNAIAYDPLEDAYADPTGGIEDLRAGVLRPADPARFLDDPVRALRVVQLAARLHASPTPELRALCGAARLHDQPAERLREEVAKLLLRADRPSEGLSLGRELGVLAQVLPELAGGAELDAPVDRAAGLRARAGEPPRPLALMLGVLLHRCAAEQAAACLARLDVHRSRGYPLAERALSAATDWPRLQVEVDAQALRLLAERSEVAIVGLAALAVARPGSAEADFATRALHLARGMGIVHEPVPVLLQGRDLVRAGVPPGPALGRLLDIVRTAQLRGEVDTSQAALQLALRAWASSGSA